MKKLAVTVLLLSITIIVGQVIPSFAQDGNPDEIWGSGTIQGIDGSAGKIVLRHDPIPDIGWPEMTMRFGVVEGVSLEGLEPDSQVDFSLVPQADGQFLIKAIKVSD